MKAKITITIEHEYEIVPENYPTGLSEQAMLNLDIEGAQDDPCLYLFSPTSTIKVEGKLIP